MTGELPTSDRLGAISAAEQGEGHTPGPWEAKGCAVEGPGTPTGRQTIIAVSRTQNVSVAVAEANARLIAAAPDMLAALEPFAAIFEKVEAFVEARAKDGGSPILPSSDFRLADFRRARAALSKATGTQS